MGERGRFKKGREGRERLFGNHEGEKQVVKREEKLACRKQGEAEGGTPETHLIGTSQRA